MVKEFFIKILKLADGKDTPEATDHIDPKPTAIEARLYNQVASKGELDIHSPTWAFVVAWATDRLNKSRIKNDNLNKDAMQTAALRGEIKVLKDLLGIPDEKKKGLLVIDNE